MEPISGLYHFYQLSNFPRNQTGLLPFSCLNPDPQFHHIHKWKPSHFLQKSQILAPLSSLIFTKPSASAAKFDDERAAPAAVPNSRSTVSEVIAGLGIFGLGKYLGHRCFRTFISKLNQSEVDLIIESLSLESPDSAFAFFNFLRNECDFRHSRIAEFIVAHVLAANRQFQELGSVVKQMVDEEGPGSAPSLCELLLRRFRDWDSVCVVWDTMAFACSRSEMVHDALSVLAKMRDFEFEGSLEEALEFTKDMERHGVQPDTVTYNILCKGFHLLGLMSGARKVIQQMLFKGLNPDHVTYTIMICGHSHVGNIDEALKL